jgi:hypothetical protein
VKNHKEEAKPPRSVTLRQFILDISTGQEKQIYRHLHDKGRRLFRYEGDLEETAACYRHVIEELLSKPKIGAGPMPIVLVPSREPEKSGKFEVLLLNRRAVDPPARAKPWGGRHPPPGYYNCNLVKYNRYYTMAGVAWSQIIDTPVINKGDYPPPVAMAEILWELTFHGWTEEENKKFMDELKHRLQEAEAGFRRSNNGDDLAKKGMAA